MHRFHGVERTRVLAGIAKQTALWLLPWACVLVVSGTVAFAGEQAAEQTLLNRSAQLEIADASNASGALISTEAMGVVGVAGTQWVLLSSANPEARVSCLTTTDRVSADMLGVHPDDLDRLVAEVCTDGRATSATQSTQPTFFPGRPY
jgi:hypothetical protein